MTPTDDLATVLEAAERALDLRKVIGSGANLQEEAKALARLVEALLWERECRAKGTNPVVTGEEAIAIAARSIRGQG